jgi:hypothetical protein
VCCGSRPVSALRRWQLTVAFGDSAIAKVMYVMCGEERAGQVISEVKMTRGKTARVMMVKAMIMDHDVTHRHVAA